MAGCFRPSTQHVQKAADNLGSLFCFPSTDLSMIRRQARENKEGESFGQLRSKQGHASSYTRRCSVRKPGVEAHNHFTWAGV